MTYRDPDSGLEFPSYEEYERQRYEATFGSEPPERDREQEIEERCEAEGHPYHGDHNGFGRCYCGAQRYPEGGPEA